MSSRTTSSRTVPTKRGRDLSSDEEQGHETTEREAKRAKHGPTSDVRVFAEYKTHSASLRPHSRLVEFVKQAGLALNVHDGSVSTFVGLCGGGLLSTCFESCEKLLQVYTTLAELSSYPHAMTATLLGRPEEETEGRLIIILGLFEATVRGLVDKALEARSKATSDADAVLACRARMHDYYASKDILSQQKFESDAPVVIDDKEAYDSATSSLFCAATAAMYVFAGTAAGAELVLDASGSVSFMCILCQAEGMRAKRGITFDQRGERLASPIYHNVARHFSVHMNFCRSNNGVVARRYREWVAAAVKDRMQCTFEVTGARNDTSSHEC